MKVSINTNVLKLSDIQLKVLNVFMNEIQKIEEDKQNFIKMCFPEIGDKKFKVDIARESIIII